MSTLPNLIASLMEPFGYAFMQRAAEYGAKFYACPQALDEHGIAQADFIPEVTGVAGAAAFLGRCMDDQWVTVTY